MTTPTQVTYKLFLDNKDHVLTIDQLAQSVKDKRIKPDTRIYNNETDCWINFQEYDRLIKIINAIYSQTKADEDKVKPTGTHSLLVECSRCSHSYSRRAEKCPKCGNTANRSCNICNSAIPMASTSCPECGDPDPFGSVTDPTGTSQRMTKGVTSAPASVNQKRATPVQPWTDPPEQLTASPNDRKKMNQFLRWAIIIGSYFGASTIVLIIQDIKVESYVQSTPFESAFLAVIRALFMFSVPCIAFYLTRFKVLPIESKANPPSSDNLPISSQIQATVPPHPIEADRRPEHWNI